MATVALRSEASQPSAPVTPGADLPAWPVLVLLWGYPLFWATGMLTGAAQLLAVPMIAFLVLRRRVRLVPGVAAWFCYVAWAMPCLLMIGGAGGMMGPALKLSHYAALGVMMVYIINAREQLTPRRLLNGLALIWVFVIVAGYLGMLFPEGRLTVTVGLLLPESLLSNEYVRDLAFPVFAEVQNPWGAAEPFVRPSAPFPYANGWGSAMSILTPIVVGCAISHRTARAIWLVGLGLLAALPPAVATTNRGLFVGLGLAIAYVLIRLLLSGRWQPFLAVSVLATAGVTLLAMSGLFDAIATRQESSDTTTGRMTIYQETFQRTLESPIMGHGAPRPGLTTEIFVGTQGELWNAMFCFGFVGLAIFLTFMIGAVVRTANAPNVATLWLHAAIVVAVGISPFYGLERQMLFVAVVLALLLREKYLGDSTYWTRTPVAFYEKRASRPAPPLEAAVASRAA